jgi:ATP-dependent helicase/nuclease subunit A
MSGPRRVDQANLIIRASAGTGKTFQLANRFIGLLLRDEPVDEILATTFTRKAAGEILDRVLFKLAEAATDEKACAELAKHLDAPSLDRGQSRKLLVRAVRRLHRFRVGTLDSFFGQIARSFGFELGLPPGWAICDEQEDRRLRDDAILAVLEGNNTDDLLSLTHALTKGETNRAIGELIRSTVDSLHSLYVETTPEAWDRLKAPKPLRPADLADAINTVRAAEFDDKRFNKARNSDCDRADAEDWDDFIGGGLAAKVLDGSCAYYRKPIPDEVVKQYGLLLDHAKAVLVGRLARQNQGTRQLLEKFDAEYRRLKEDLGAMRFEDVTQRLADASEWVGMDRLAFRLDGATGHLLLDEFQDTSLAQWRVIRPFARNVTAGEDKTFFCVGDVKQAIYGWRGGVAEIFDALPNQLTDISFDRLNTSYRSAPEIIETVNRVFTGLLNHDNLDRALPAVTKWCGKFETHTTARTELKGYVRLETAPSAEEGEKQTDANLVFAADRVAELVGQAPGCSIGVLVRRNSAVARLIYELRQRGINASEEGGNPLTDSAAVRLVLSLMKLADHPGDTIARQHLVGSPLGVNREFEDAKNNRIAAVATSVRRDLLADGYGPTVDGLARELAPRCDRREWSRLSQLVERAYAYQSSATLRPRDFVDFIETQKVADPTADNVRVMTIHQAKGLQFDAVVLPELDADIVGQPASFVVERSDPTGPVESVCRYVSASFRDLLPERFRKMFEADVAREVNESLCNLYVAITRPIHALYMIVSPANKREKKLPRRFAGLLRAALVDDRAAEPETLLDETGHADWPRYVHAEVPAQSDEEAAQDGEFAVRLKPSSNRRRDLQRTSPSKLEGGTKIKLAEAFLAGSDAMALRLGTLHHGWFERIEWLDDGAPTDAELTAAAMSLGAASVDLEKEIGVFRHRLARRAVQDCLSKERYSQVDNLPFSAAVRQRIAEQPLRLTVENEREFAVLDGDSLLGGSIDRLVLMRHGEKLIAAEIIDFKTDTIDADDPAKFAEKVEYYQPQLDAYRRAVRGVTGLAESHIAAGLLFVSPGVYRAC